MSKSNKIVVYCSVKDCLFWEPLPEGEEHHVGEDKRDFEPFADCKYTGICTCRKLFVGIRNVHSYNSKYEIPECKCFSLKKRRGHMDFSRFPQGGQVIG